MNKRSALLLSFFVIFYLFFNFSVCSAAWNQPSEQVGRDRRTVPSEVVGLQHRRVQVREPFELRAERMLGAPIAGGKSVSVV